MLALVSSLARRQGLYAADAARAYAEFWLSDPERGYPDSAQFVLASVPIYARHYIYDSKPNITTPDIRTQIQHHHATTRHNTHNSSKHTTITTTIIITMTPICSPQVLEGASLLQTGRALFASGSFANGGAMRIAPIGVAFRSADSANFLQAVRNAIVSSHVHEEVRVGEFSLRKHCPDLRSLCISIIYLLKYRFHLLI